MAVKIERQCCNSVKGEEHTVTCGAVGVPLDAELRQRPEDQVLPVRNGNPFIHQLVIQDIHKRMELGIRRYGTALQGHNGRDVEQDIYEELLDAACYMRQKIWERDNPKGTD